MPLDLARLVAERSGDAQGLFETHLNEQLLRVLRTIGFDVSYARAEGPYLWDTEGNRYLDLLSGFGVFAVGRNHPAIAQAIGQVLGMSLPNLVQMGTPLLAGLLAERLLRLMPGMDKLFFCSSGTEAVEAAMKFARAATGRSRILHCEHAFHGLTYGALSLNGDRIFRQGFEPLLPGCSAVPFNDLVALEAELRGREVAAFVVEPIQGKGVNLPDPAYLAEAARLCRKYGTLFVADEVQTGLGRTGRFLALEHWAVEADMVLLAKALSGGAVPVGAVACKRWIFEKVFNRMDRAVVHGSTFSKNDLAMAAGLATLTVLEEERLIERAAALGERILRDLGELTRFEFVNEVRGKGLMIAVEFGPPRSLRLKAAWGLLDQANKGLFCQLVTIPLFQRHRILSQVAGHGLYVIKLLPPLVIGEDDCAWIRHGFDEVVADCHKVPGAVWELGKTLAGNAIRARAAVA